MMNNQTQNRFPHSWSLMSDISNSSLLASTRGPLSPRARQVQRRVRLVSGAGKANDRKNGAMYEGSSQFETDVGGCVMRSAKEGFNDT